MTAAPLVPDIRVDERSLQGEVRSFVGPLIPPMGCAKLNLQDYIPDIHRHLGGQPGLIKLRGWNILEKPFFYQTDGTFIAADHL